MILNHPSRPSAVIPGFESELVTDVCTQCLSAVDRNLALSNGQGIEGVDALPEAIVVTWLFRYGRDDVDRCMSRKNRGCRLECDEQVVVEAQDWRKLP